jgi:hypothetical protein
MINKDVIAAVKRLFTVAENNVFVFERESTGEILIVRDKLGVVYSCVVLHMDNMERWEVTEWGPCGRDDIIAVHVFVCRFEFLSWLMGRFLEADND